MVDDGSTPPLESVVESFKDRLQVDYIRVPNRGPATARNHGARAARGRYLAFTDHDCAPAPEWLTALRDRFSASPDVMLGGPKENGLSANPYSSAHQIASNYAEQWFRRVPGGGTYFTTNNLAVPRETFLRLGGFNESFSFAHEDREFGVRWAGHGLHSAWAPDAMVIHRHELTLRNFLRQHFRYGAGAIEFRAARRRVEVPRRVRFEGLQFHFGLVAAPFAQGRGWRSVQLAALLASAQAAYLAGVLTRAATWK